MPMPIEKKYTAEEFEKLELPERCELIDGYIYIGECVEKYDPQKAQIANMAPAPNYIHQEISANIVSDIIHYIRKQNGKCKVFSAPADVKLDDDIIVQPDIFVTCDPNRLDGRYHNGAPDWIIEILSPSTAKRDSNDKLYLYKTHGVREYWIIDPEAKRIIVYLFDNSSNIELYTFSDSVPVHIYKNSPEPLFIRLADYID